MIKYFVAALIMVTGFCGRGVNPEAQKPTQDTAAQDSERYAVYSAVVTDMFVRGSTKLLVIEDQTADDFTAKQEDRSDYIKNGLAPISQATVDDFRSKKDQAFSLENKFTLTIKVTLISKAETDKIFGEGGGWWKTFYEKYPNSHGLITFSNVGFNPAMTEALVYVGYTCGGLCGTGNYVLLSKVGGNWKVKRKVGTWIS